MRRKKSTQPKYRIGWAVQVVQEPKHLNSIPTWRPLMDIFKGRIGHILFYQQFTDLTWGYQIKVVKRDMGLYSECFFFREEWLIEHTGEYMSNEQRENNQLRSRWRSIVQEEK